MAGDGGRGRERAGEGGRGRERAGEGGRGRERVGEGGRGRGRAGEGERWRAARLEAHQVVELVDVDAVALVADDVEQEALILAAPNVGRPSVLVVEPLDEQQHEVELLLA
jgi:hypothetical protein